MTTESWQLCIVQAARVSRRFGSGRRRDRIGICPKRTGKVRDADSQVKNPDFKFVSEGGDRSQQTTGCALAEADTESVHAPGLSPYAVLTLPCRYTLTNIEVYMKTLGDLRKIFFPAPELLLDPYSSTSFLHLPTNSSQLCPKLPDFAS